LEEDKEAEARIDKTMTEEEEVTEDTKIEEEEEGKIEISREKMKDL
jgi:hypothetical protein